jgi:hypothetical protein
LAAESYPEWLARDLSKIIGWVVPREKEGLLNLLSAKQVRGSSPGFGITQVAAQLTTALPPLQQMLESWKTKRLLPVDVLAGALQTLEERRALLVLAPPLCPSEGSTDALTNLVILQGHTRIRRRARRRMLRAAAVATSDASVTARTGSRQRRRCDEWRRTANEYVSTSS